MLDRTSQPAMDISLIKVTTRFRRDLGDIASLAADIDAVGLLQPIVVSSANELIAGERRLRAWKLTRFKDRKIPVHIVDLAAIARGEWSER